MKSSPSSRSLWLSALVMLGCAGAERGGDDLVGAPDASRGDATGEDSSTFTLPDSSTSGGDGGGCEKPTCAALGANCGTVTDTVCGGTLECGACPSGSTCGGGGKPNVCGAPDAGACTPKTCAELGAECGKTADGCGGLVDCGACEAGTCGGGGVPFKCGGVDAGPCTKVDCAAQGLECGPAGDGCGGVLACGTCAAPDTCGGGGKPGKCGRLPPCTPKTCKDLGASCGAQSDGCGGLISCGVCSFPKGCGGDPSKPLECGCTGPCALLPTCAPGTTTTLTGTVKDPAGLTPLHDVLVYVPNNPTDPALDAFGATVSCEQCGAAVAGNPLVSTQTDTDGNFRLEGVPVGKGLPLIIQIGRWRRRFSVDIPTSCAANVVTGTGAGGTTISGGVLTMPKNKAQGNIPKTAIVTGLGDPIECVFLKMGIDKTEFTDPGKGGRVEMYVSDARGGSFGTSLAGSYIDLFTTPYASAMMPKLKTYDMVVFGCPGAEAGGDFDDELLSPTNIAALVDYANSGGRLFTSHFAYTYLKAGGASNPFYGTVNWSAAKTKFTSAVATVETDTAKNPKGPKFAEWLGKVGALSSSAPPTLTVAEARYDVASVNAPTQQWLTFTPAAGVTAPLHFTFNTPVGADSAKQCGRVMFSDYHVVSAAGGGAFPTECSAGPLSAREKILEYMIFDLGSCVKPYTPACKPRTCADAGVECGFASDGCGGALSCGTCAAGSVCGVPTPGKCGAPKCTPRTCTDAGVECGYASDGCGGLLTCGTCEAGKTCGLGGPGKCGAADGGACKPLTCAEQGIECGSAGDGCGNSIKCPDCPAGTVCGALSPGKCGAPPCTPRSCADQGIDCGSAGDGCGNKLECGNCPSGGICGLAAPGKCGTIK
jgi:hypothetical protein